MARAKCKHCREWLDTKVALQVSINGKNQYYCSEDCKHIDEDEAAKQAKSTAEYNEIFDVTKEIFGYEFTGYSLLRREIIAWEKLATREKIIAYLNENKKWLSGVMSKEFNGDYNRVRYYSVVVSSKLHDFKPVQKEEPKPKVVVDEEIYEAPSHTSNKRRSLADVEDMF